MKAILFCGLILFLCGTMKNMEHGIECRYAIYPFYVPTRKGDLIYEISNGRQTRKRRI